MFLNVRFPTWQPSKEVQSVQGHLFKVAMLGGGGAGYLNGGLQHSKADLHLLTLHWPDRNNRVLEGCVRGGQAERGQRSP